MLVLPYSALMLFAVASAAPSIPQASPAPAQSTKTQTLNYNAATTKLSPATESPPHSSPSLTFSAPNILPPPGKYPTSEHYPAAFQPCLLAMLTSPGARSLQSTDIRLASAPFRHTRRLDARMWGKSGGSPQGCERYR
ncbi:hypothetical protein K458DRAFT_107083 [Lentithecium fluviatile CBS 122367]|uniref:Lytic polysaccharide monooxygenase n=1 Tax=Lentithecium fluviatile CBS 122367 TaxID=1168545 RepID=A0A6G1IPE9_9PLEO|nr:hypothetical protein K458DRAFT_107083 [Lentithecium fluviatile CBS 122367]